MNLYESVNIWSLKKDIRLKRLLLMLDQHLGQTEWYVDLSDNTSYEAVYLTHKEQTDLRVYLHIHGQHDGRAGLHLEFPQLDASVATYESYDNLGISQIIQTLAVHFGISQFAGVPA